eukprot:scaffold81338_cov27-Prasinocladus_malaysianus.AAC.1
MTAKPKQPDSTWNAEYGRGRVPIPASFSCCTYILSQGSNQAVLSNCLPGNFQLKPAKVITMQTRAMQTRTTAYRKFINIISGLFWSVQKSERLASRSPTASNSTVAVGKVNRVLNCSIRVAASLSPLACG